MTLQALTELVARVRATSKKSEKVALIADLLRQTRDRESELLALYLTGTLPQGRIGLGWRSLQAAMPEGPRQGAPLELLELDRVFDDVAAQRGSGSAERRAKALRGLLERADE